MYEWHVYAINFTLGWVLASWITNVNLRCASPISIALCNCYVVPVLAVALYTDIPHFIYLFLTCVSTSAYEAYGEI